MQRLLYKRTSAFTGGFAEERVQGNGASYLTATGSPSDSDMFLVFCRIEPVDDAREALVSFDSTNTAFYAPFESTADSMTGLTTRPMQTDTGAAITGSETFDDDAANSTSVVLDYLFSGDISGGSGSGVFRCSRYDGTSWTTVQNETSAGFASGTDIDFSYGSAPRLLCNNASVTHEYNGVVSRIAMWTGVAPDVTQTSVRNNFVDTSDDSLVDPATSQSAYSSGTLLFDFYELDHFNLDTTPDGTLSWTLTGSDFALAS